MDHLHDSPVKTHGRLKSCNCVVDARWVCRITDYGLFKMRAPIKEAKGYFSTVHVCVCNIKMIEELFQINFGPLLNICVAWTHRYMDRQKATFIVSPLLFKKFCCETDRFVSKIYLLKVCVSFLETFN